MNKWYALSLVLLVLACSSEKKQAITEESVTESEVVKDPPSTALSADELDPDKMRESAIGFYVGTFNADKYDGSKNITYYNKINISVDSVTDNIMYGHSVVAGNDRPFSGTYSIDENKIIAEVKEPGDDRYDGIFSFTLFPLNGLMNGYWTAYDSTLGVYKRQYALDRKEYSYQPQLDLPNNVRWTELGNAHPGLDDFMEVLTEDVKKKNPSSELLTKEDVENMYRGDLEIMRNSIYARHGYSFKNRQVRFIFDRYVDWYIPVSTDIRDKLTDLEMANIDMIKRYEEHADRYYDDFGR